MFELSHIIKNKKNRIIILISSLIIIGLIGVTVALTYNSVQPQTLQNGADANIYLDLIANGNTITGTAGDITPKIDVLNFIEIDSFRGGVSVPYESATGMATGQRTYQPIVITKDIDLASPLIFQALATNQAIVASFYHLREDNGELVNFFTIILSNARLSSIRQYSITMDDGSVRHMEEIAFVFGTITCIYDGPDGIYEFTDDWSSGA